RRHRDIEPVLIQRRRTGNVRRRMRLDVLCPELRARRGVQRVDVRAAIAKIDGRRCPRGRAENDGGPYAGFRLERPDDATSPRVERSPRAALTPDEHAAAGHGRLRARGIRAWEAERPFQLEFRSVLRRQTRLFGRLKALVRVVRSPPAPGRTLRRIE